MKTYTDLEQSRKLAEFLPIESADMRYGYIAPYEFSDRMYEGGYDNVPYPKDFLKKNPNFSENDYDDSLPCWSLAALLELIRNFQPNNQSALFVGKEDGYQYMSGVYLTTHKHNNPVDVCYDMILELHKLNIL